MIPLMRSGQGTSYVYVIGSAENTAVKIGTTGSITKRLQALQTGSPYRLSAFWYTVGARELEKRLHERFAEYRVEGEWFDFGDDDAVVKVADAVTELSKPPGQQAPSPSALHSARAWHFPATWDKDISVWDRISWYRHTFRGPLQALALVTSVAIICVSWWIHSGTPETAHRAAGALLDSIRGASALQVLAASAVFFVLRTMVKDLAPPISRLRTRCAASVRKRLRPAPRLVTDPPQPVVVPRPGPPSGTAKAQ